VTEQRSFPADLEIRGDGRTVVGLAAPFGVTTRIGDPMYGFDETIRRGAFARSIRERGDKIKFLAMHNYEALPIGRATLLREDPAGLYGEFRVSKTQAGDEVLELIRDGSLDGLSIGFFPLESGSKWSANRDAVELTEVKLIEVSAVTFPAFETALISGVRSASTVPHLLAAMTRLHQFRK
jgi:HK97 family phage prohead protease